MKWTTPLLLFFLFSCAQSEIQQGVWKSDKVMEKKSATRPTSVAQVKMVPQKIKSVENAKKLEKKLPLKTEELLAIISTDYVTKTYNLSVELGSENQITSIKTKNNKKNKVKKYQTDLLNKDIPLVKTLGISIITLKCHNFSPEKGCPIEIEYPYNITYGKFKRFQAQIKKVDGQWGLYSGDRKFSSMRLIAKKFAGLLIGIKQIELK